MFRVRLSRTRSVNDKKRNFLREKAVIVGHCFFCAFPCRPFGEWIIGLPDFLLIFRYSLTLPFDNQRRMSSPRKTKYSNYEKFKTSRRYPQPDRFWDEVGRPSENCERDQERSRTGYGTVVIRRVFTAAFGHPDY